MTKMTLNLEPSQKKYVFFSQQTVERPNNIIWKCSSTSSKVYKLRPKSLQDMSGTLSGQFLTRNVCGGVC